MRIPRQVLSILQELGFARVREREYIRRQKFGCYLSLWFSPQSNGTVSLEIGLSYPCDSGSDLYAVVSPAEYSFLMPHGNWISGEELDDEADEIAENGIQYWSLNEPKAYIDRLAATIRRASEKLVDPDLMLAGIDYLSGATDYPPDGLPAVSKYRKRKESISLLRSKVAYLNLAGRFEEALHLAKTKLSADESKLDAKLLFDATSKNICDKTHYRSPL